MITKVIMPQMSLTMQVGFIAKWLKVEGQFVEKGEPICTIEGDKASIDLEAPASGILKKIVAQEGSEFPVKQAVAYIGDQDDVIEYETTELPETSKSDTVATDRISKETNSKGRINASPIAKRIAKEKGIDLSQLTGSGPNGLIGKNDVLEFAEKMQTSRSNVTSKDLNNIEKAIAEKMTQSNQEIPHFHLTLTCKVGEVNKLRKDENRKNHDEPHLTLTDVIIWALSRSLVKYPVFNSSFQENKIIIHENINIGIAINSPNGLLVVVVKDADKRSLFDISKTRTELTERALEGKQTPEDLSGGTFTISNLGMFAIESFDPIITPGQVGILGVGSLVKYLELDHEQNIQSREKMSLTLGCDHRAVSGVKGAEFLSSIKEMVEQPVDMFK